MGSGRNPPDASMSSVSDAESSHRSGNRGPLHERRFAHLLHRLSPLLSIETGHPHPDFPQTLLHYHLLSEKQLDDLAHFYHQRTPGCYSLHYPMPVVGRWWQPRAGELEEGEIDEMEEIKKILELSEQVRSEKVATVEDKRRRFGRFLGLRNCESSVGEGDMQRKMDEWIASEIAKRQQRDREREIWRYKGYWR